MNINNLFKYKKSIDFGKYNNGDETFFSRCEHCITKFRFKIHQTGEVVENVMPILTTYFPEKGCYDITCTSEMEEGCTHPHKNISTYKKCVYKTDMVIIGIIIGLFSVLIVVGLIWLIILGLSTLF